VDDWVGEVKLAEMEDEKLTGKVPQVPLSDFVNVVAALLVKSGDPHTAC